MIIAQRDRVTLAENLLGEDLADVAVLDGPTVCRRLTRTGRVAAARGRVIALSAGAGDEVLVHECVHVLQQTRGAVWDRRGDSEAQLEAEARRVTDGLFRRGPMPVRRRDQDRLPPRWQGHDSFEHRLLGDTPTNLLTALVAGQGPQAGRDAGLASACALLDYLGSNPTAVDPAQVSQIAGFPVSMVTLTGSGLTVTYGELNMMADYLSSPYMIDTVDQSVLLPILQMTRNSGWEQLNALRSNPLPSTDQTIRSYLPDVVINSAAAMWETHRLDSLTTGLGPSGRDHYQGLNARNACHFAPYTWWRWQASYATAVTAAQAAYASGGDAELTRQAWLAHGYADHFLQDSFAAGHLVNKTLVMQWFLEWVAGEWMPVYDWDTINSLTQANQPGLAGSQLYSPTYTGISTDPQTTEELSPQSARIANTGLVPAAGLSLQQAYQAYLAMLDSTVCQIVTKCLHDYLNGRSVMVSSTREAAYQIFGDASMLDGGTGVGFASAAATASRASIADILATGGTDTTWQQLFATFPTQVLSEGSYVTLQAWHARGGELWNLCRSSEVFDSWTAWGVGSGSHALPDMGIVSVDQVRSNTFKPAWGPATGVGVDCATQPATCTVSGSTYVVTQSAPGGSLTCTIGGPGVGATAAALGVSPAGPPAMAVIDGLPTVAWVADDGSISTLSTGDGGTTWTRTDDVGAISGGVPAGGVGLTELDGTTYLFWVLPPATTPEASSAPATQIGWATTGSGGGSTGQGVLPQSSGGTVPVAANDGQTVYVAFQTGTSGISVSALPAAGTWTTAARKNVKTSGGVGLSVVGGGPLLAYRGQDGQLWWDALVGGTWSNQHLVVKPSCPPAVGSDLGGNPTIVYAQNGALATVSQYQGSWQSIGYSVGAYYSDTPPALVPYGDGLCLFSTINSQIMLSTLTQGTWGTTTIASPLDALSRVDADVYVGSGDTESLWLAATDSETLAVQVATFDGTTWTMLPPVTGRQAGAGEVAIVNFDDTMYVFYASGTSLCFAAWEAASSTWTNLGAVPGVVSPSSVSVTIVGDTLCVAYVSTAKSSSQKVYTVSWDGSTWQAPLSVSGDTALGVSAAGYSDALIVVMLGTDANLYERWSPSAGATWSGRTKLGPANRAPALAVAPGAGGVAEATELLAVFPAGNSANYSGLLSQAMTVPGT